jgi:hypothetical protein
VLGGFLKTTVTLTLHGAEGFSRKIKKHFVAKAKATITTTNMDQRIAFRKSITRREGERKERSATCAGEGGGGVAQAKLCNAAKRFSNSNSFTPNPATDTSSKFQVSNCLELKYGTILWFCLRNGNVFEYLEFRLFTARVQVPVLVLY